MIELKQHALLDMTNQVSKLVQNTSYLFDGLNEVDCHKNHIVEFIEKYLNVTREQISIQTKDNNMLEIGINYPKMEVFEICLNQ